MTDELRKPDDYEAEYMSDDDGGVIHREKMSFALWFRWAIAIVLIAALGLEFATAFQAWDVAAMAMLGITTPLIFLFLIMMSTLRVTVTKDKLAVQYGPFGPQIPIDAIEVCEAEDYNAWKYGGYGIRYSFSERAWCFNMIGDKGKAVRVLYRDEKGHLKRVLIASARHHVLADSINRARGLVDDAALGLDDDVYFAEETRPVEQVEEQEAVETQKA